MSSHQQRFDNQASSAIFADSLLEMLQLDRIGDDVFSGRHSADVTSRSQIFGGQIAAQALLAAGGTVPLDRYPHSFHGYFLRSGRRDQPLHFHVTRAHDGRSFSARWVTARQGNGTIFSMQASFHVDGGGPSLEPPLPTDLVMPEVLERQSGLHLVDRRNRKERQSGEWTTSKNFFELRDQLWVRSVETLPEDRLLHACALTYISDFSSGFRHSHFETYSSNGASLDHSVWFQSPIRADDWIAMDLRPVKVQGGRGVYNGTLHNRQGELGALFTQEVLLLPKAATATQSFAQSSTAMMPSGEKPNP